MSGCGDGPRDPPRRVLPIVGSGDLTADEFASYVGELEGHLSSPGTLTCQPIMWQAWGRVPA